jgi:hypothetical protein
MIELVSLADGWTRPRANFLTPSDFLALVDPRARWLQSWLHSKFGRALVFSQLKNNNALLGQALHSLRQALEIQKQAPLLVSRGSGRGKSVVTSQLQNFSGFVYSLNVATLIVMSRKGAELISGLPAEPLESILRKSISAKKTSNKLRSFIQKYIIQRLQTNLSDFYR